MRRKRISRDSNRSHGGAEKEERGEAGATSIVGCRRRETQGINPQISHVTTQATKTKRS